MMSWDTFGTSGGGGAWSAGTNNNDRDHHAATHGGYVGGEAPIHEDKSNGLDIIDDNNNVLDYHKEGGGGPAGGCFNCGQEGHIKADCPIPAVLREFTGSCRVCGDEGHRASDCPTKPPMICRNCMLEGHEAVSCENPRKIDRSQVADITPEVAWRQMTAAVKDRDIDDVKVAAEAYLKVHPDTTYEALEKSFRSLNIGVYLIAIEKELASTYTNMDAQGNLGKKYTITWRFSDKPNRPKEKEGWPESSEENIARLTDAGVPVDCGKPKCSNCNEIGHLAKSCEQEKNDITDRAAVKCFNCDGMGHRVRDCPNPRADRFACRNCQKSGHSSKECPEPRSAEGIECKKCGEVGHFSKDCPSVPQRPCFNCNQLGHNSKDCTNEKVMICRNCDAEGHISKECPKPRDYSRVKCSNCQQMGHTKVRCKEPLVDDNEAPGGGGSYATAAATSFAGQESTCNSVGADKDFGAVAGGDENWGSGAISGGGW